jgi:hypothetical protein
MALIAGKLQYLDAVVASFKVMDICDNGDLQDLCI